LLPYNIAIVALLLNLGADIRNPGRGGGGGENSQKQIRAKKNAWKIIRAAITSEKKNSCKQTAKLNALKKNPAET
jgi:hypothetical protein